ncbi:glycoside hydrolase family 97 N-terminal domain-containing protein [Robinsoniella sp. KNHs210]|uniref:glycoside hydrolase family 97 N-terminal domain-containing protein n=1 Tax=Robinsoniella sp. KNHs210 TaxID=1469950 RepID=UPI00048072B1|nr:glycoside hydrolase family 97 N-terminal domain-containing protein [Robinsoniella sp. KNHs210]
MGKKKRSGFKKVNAAVAVMLSIQLSIGSVMPAFANEQVRDDIQTDLIYETEQETQALKEVFESVSVGPILEFDFSKTETVDNVTSVVGIANGEEAIATAQNVIFETDEDSNDIAVFPEGGDNAATGITYTPGDNDPMKSLAQGNGATIAMWVKTAQDTFSSTLFAYGSRQNADAGDLGASIQIIGRNNTSGDTVFYRNASGSTGGHKVAGVGNPYLTNTWQLVTFVENENGTGTLYVDGVERGTCKSSDKTLLGFATDGATPDHYYFGFLPYVSGTDTHFTGAMDSISVYDKAFTAEQVQSLYNERVKPEVDKTALNDAITSAEDLAEADYTAESWEILATAVNDAKAVSGNIDATEQEVNAAIASITAAIEALVAVEPEKPDMVLDAGWEIENPTEGNLVVNEDGSVTITTEGGTVDTAGGMKNILYYKIPNQTDYDFTVKVKGNFTANYQGAHLMIASGKNRENAVAVVRRYHGYLSGKYGTSMLMGVMQNGGSPNEYYEGAADIGNEFYLKLQKQNGRITGFYAAEYSDNKEDWNQIIDSNTNTEYVDKGNGLIDPENIYVAIAAANGGENNPTNITFSDLRIGGQPVPMGINTSALASVVLSGEAKMEIAATQALSLAGTDYDGNEIKKFDSVVYTSSDEEVATVSKDGVVTGVHNGKVVITAAATVGGITKTADLSIQIGDIVEKTWELSSPDGNTKMAVEMITGGVLQYRAEQNKVQNIGTSPLGLVTSLGDFSKGLVFKKASEVKEINESYKVLSGKSDEYTDHCNEQTLTFTVKNNDSVEFDLVIRAYDDGTAYRYAVRTDGEQEIRISDEVSGLQLPKEADVYWMNYTSATWNYESQYQVTTTEGLAVDATPSMPFLYGKDGVWTLFSEADLNGSFCGSMFTVKENGMLDVSFAKQQTKDVVTTTPFKSPWRAAITGTPADIVENTMIENLSTPADYETYDFESWVDPGLSSWSWVTNWGSGVSDQSKAETHLNWIKFGAEIGWDYYILDEGWNKGGRGNVSGMYDWWPEVKACAEENGVRLWAWVHVSDIDTQEERDRHFSEWAKEGIVGIKPDFFDGEGQGRMQLYDDLYKDAAKYGLMLLVHGANKPTGEIRTWPNVYGREAIRGQEAGGITAEQYTMIPFIRAAIGPAEVTEEIRSKDYNKTTMGFQFALTALVEDGIHSMGSAPDVYRSIPEGMSYYKNYPKKWDETKLVDGAVGEQVSIARRTGNNWYVSGISVEPRTMQVPLECLDENKEYTVLLYRENGRRDVDMDIIPNVTNETVLEVDVLYGGGYALRAVPTAEMDSIKSIAAEPAEVKVEKGHLSDQVAITLSPENAEFKDVAWSTADEAIATVSDRGVIRGVAEGKTTVTVASAYDKTVKAEIKVTVTPARYVLDEKTWSILNANENVMIKDTGSATITTENGVLGAGNWENMFSMDVPEGDRDFTITAKMTGGLKANYQGGFITVFDKADPNGQSVAAGRRHHSGMLGGSHPQGFGVMSTASGRTTEFYCEDKDYGVDVYVKLEKTGNTFTSSYSYDGETWTVITNKGTSQTTTNANLAASANLCVGFYAGSGGEDTAIDITFSDFTYNGVKVPVAIDTQAQEEVDKTALNKAIATAEALKEADYTSESWKVLASAVKAAKDAAADEKATQQEVNDATAAIAEALEALVAAKPEVVVDRKALKEAIAQANAISAEALKQYTDESVRTFKNALAAAAGLAEKASQKEVDAAAAALQAAMKGLVKKPVTPPVVQKEISKLSIGSIKAQTHTGSSLKPIISIKDGSKVLKQDVDYTVYYKNNKNPGTAQIIITGKGSYKGSLTKTFVILAKKGRTYTVGNYKYKVLSASTKSGTVSLTKPVKNTLKTVKVPDTVKIGNYRYKVTEIGKSAFKRNNKLKTVKIGKNVKKIGTAAFYNDKALKTITVYSKVIKSVGKNALKGIHARAVIKVPKSKLKSYQSRFAKKGQKSTVVIRK